MEIIWIFGKAGLQIWKERTLNMERTDTLLRPAVQGCGEAADCLPGCPADLFLTLFVLLDGPDRDAGGFRKFPLAQSCLLPQAL